MSPLENWQHWVSLEKLGLKEFPKLQPFVWANVYEDMGATIQGVGRHLQMEE